VKYSIFLSTEIQILHTLYIPQQFDHQIHGAERCFSEIEYLNCNTSINDNVLDGLTKISKSIKELELIIEGNNDNYEIISLIETPKKLFSINFINYSYEDELFCETLENSVIIP